MNEYGCEAGDGRDLSEARVNAEAAGNAPEVRVGKTRRNYASGRRAVNLFPGRVELRRPGAPGLAASATNAAPETGRFLPPRRGL